LETEIYSQHCGIASWEFWRLDLAIGFLQA
jgi:hypothetical protein